LLQVSTEGFEWCKEIDIDDLEAIPVRHSLSLSPASSLQFTSLLNFLLQATCTSNDKKQVWTCVVKQMPKSTKSNCSVEIVTPLVVENLLSVAMKYKFIRAADGVTLLEGDLTQTLDATVFNIPALDSSVLFSVKIAGYEWSKATEFLSKFKHIEAGFSTSNDANETIKLTMLDAKGRDLALRADVSLVNLTSAVRISVYARYWIINNTGLRLIYKEVASDKSIAAGQGTIFHLSSFIFHLSSFIFHLLSPISHLLSPISLFRTECKTSRLIHLL